jgi:rubrerythrin
MKISDCNRCQFFSHQLYFVCAIHPEGVDTEHCLDFRPDADAVEEDELWAPEGYSWYGDDLIENRPSRYTPEEQLEILDTHPFFTGTCPQCGHEFETSPPPHAPWPCPRCNWMEGTVS